MISQIILVIILLISFLIIAVIQFKASSYYDSANDKKIPHVNAPWQWKFVEIWNRFMNLSLGGLLGYYFVLVRWNPISKGEGLNLSDFVIFIIFAMSLLGWLPYFIKNITEGITAILERILERR
jgi:hypothetical protein